VNASEVADRGGSERSVASRRYGRSQGTSVFYLVDPLPTTYKGLGPRASSLSQPLKLGCSGNRTPYGFLEAPKDVGRSGVRTSPTFFRLQRREKVPQRSLFN
jgi:hypothetical protein